MHTPHHRLRQQGFSLIELVLVIVLLGFISIVGVNMIADSYKSTRIIDNGNANTSTARYALDRLSRDLRQVVSDTSTKFVEVTTAASTQMVFTESALLSSGTYTTDVITIHLVGTSLKLNNATQGLDTVLAEHVTAFSLRYFDVTMAENPAINQIRFVQINLTISDPGHAEPIALQTLVALRNNG